MKTCSECSGALSKCSDCGKMSYCAACERCTRDSDGDDDDGDRALGDDIVYRDVSFADDIAIRGIDAEKRTIDFIASDSSEDDHGTIIEPDWDLKRYRKNPAVLFNHNLPVGGFFGGGGAGRDTDQIPIAYADKVRVEDGKLKAKIIFPPEGEEERSDKVWRAVVGKRLRAMSVGFRPGKVVREEKPDGRSLYRLSGCSLYELSICPIGSNANAVAERNLRTLERRAGATTTSPVASDRPTTEHAMPPTDKTNETISGAELRSDPAITIATLAGILGCDGDEKACLRAITESASKAKGVDAVVAEQKGLVALVKATRASLNLGEAASEADVTKAIVDLQARSTKLTELEPKLVAFEKDIADRDEAVAEREVSFLIKRGADYKFTYGESAKRGLLAFRKADPKGFAEDHKAALDGLRAFDDAKTFAPIAVATTEQRGGLAPTPEQSASVENPYLKNINVNEALHRKADEIEKDHAAKGKPIKRSAALELAAKAL